MAAKKKARTSGGLEEAVRVAREAVHNAKVALAKIDLAKLTAEERKFSSGRMREGESAVAMGLLDAIDAHAPTFHSLADRDGGEDPAVLETGPSRDALRRRALLEPLAKELDELHTSVSDDMLVSAATAKLLTVPAYAIAKANAPVNAKLRKAVSGAFDFYAKLGRRKKK